jgi:hypothetical protein
MMQNLINELVNNVASKQECSACGAQPGSLCLNYKKGPNFPLTMSGRTEFHKERKLEAVNYAINTLVEVAKQLEREEAKDKYLSTEAR